MAGRPSEYDPAFCERVIACGREGYSKAELAAELDVCRNTLDNWAKAYPEFLSALQRAHDLSLAWWERQSRSGLTNREFNSTLWGRAVSGRFPKEPYRERVELGGEGGGPVQIARIERVIVKPQP